MWPFKKKRQPNYDFSDEDRKSAAETKRIKAEQRRVEAETEQLRSEIRLEKMRAELEDLKADLRGEEEEEEAEPSQFSPDGMLQMLFAKILMGQHSPANATVSPPTATLQPSPIQTQEMTDEQIQAYLQQIPRPIIKKLKNMREEDIKPLIRAHLPAIGEDTLNRAVRAINAL